MKHIGWVLLTCISLLPRCSGPASTVDNSGGGSEITNGIAARVLDRDGRPAQGATVRIRTADFMSQPLSLAKATTFENLLTDSNGYFEIRGIDIGDHRIEINDNDSSAVLLSCSITESSKLIDLGVDTLRAYAAITGTLQGADAGLSVLIRGLDRSVPVDSQGGFTFSDLPGGTYTLVAVSEDNATQSVVFDSIAVSSGQSRAVAATIVTLSPIADAHVRGGTNAAINHGSETILTVKEEEGTSLDYTRNAYLKFDLSSTTSVSKAVLRVYGKNMDDTTGVRITAFGCDSSTWTETGITWNNAPKATTDLSHAIVNGTATYYEFDVTGYVKAKIPGDGLVTIILKAAAESNKVVFFNSKESSTQKPQLTIMP